MYEKIPEELKSLEQWGVFKKEWIPERNKYTKIPVNPWNGGPGKSNDESTWSDFGTALNSIEELDCDGLAFYFKAPYFGIDVDHIPDDLGDYFLGDTSPENKAYDFISHTQSYTERSISGEGIHIIALGKLNTTKHRKENVEMYSEGRFFAMTGDKIVKTNEISEVDDKNIKYLVDKYLPDSNEKRLINKALPGANNLTVEEIISKASNSAKGKRFKLFLNGGWEEIYDSQSEADLAFANTLAFWTARDFAKMDTIFRQSDLYRDKYDSKRASSTYGTKLLQKAIDECDSVYETEVKPVFPIKSSKLKPKKKKKDHYSYDDTGNKDRFMDLYGDYAKYSFYHKFWYVYKDNVWQRDYAGLVHKLVDSTIDNMKHEKLFVGGDMSEDDAKIAMAKHIKRSRGNAGKEAMKKEIMNYVAVQPDEMDKDDDLLNVQNGYVDLKTGEFHDSDITKIFSRITNVEYTDNISAPVWEEFLNSALQGDTKLIHYLQKAVGYSLTGYTTEQVMFFLYGNGGTGKSLFLEALAYALGTYTMNMQAQSIMVKPNGNGGASSDIARLDGSRFVTSSETNEGVRMDESLVKQLTGGDRVTARYQFGNEFDFVPKFKLWVATNHKPIIRGTDDGIWRRLKIIPFKHQVKGKNQDKHLKEKLQDEAVGILKWAVDGCLMWLKEGLADEPIAIKQETKEYRLEMDVITQFIDECCFVNPDVKVKPSDLYQEYKTWAGVNSEHIFTATKFYREIGQKFEKKKNNQGRFYIGINLKNNPNPQIIKKYR